MICITCPVRNEDWILSLSARAMLLWADHVVFLDHCSTDNTPFILAALAKEYPGRVTILKEESPVWEEMRHRQRLLDTARELGATHVCLVDTDEVLTGDLLESGTLEQANGPSVKVLGGSNSKIRQMIYACPPSQTMQLPWLCLRNSKDLVHRSGVWGEQNVSMGFVDNPMLGWSAAERGTYDFHHRAPMGRAFTSYRPVTGRGSGLLHFQFVNANRLRYKQLAYCLTERSRWSDRETPDQVRRKYSLSIYGKDEPPAMDFDLGACPPAWLDPYAHLMHHYHPEAEPWQKQQCVDMLSDNPDLSHGLDDFGTGLFYDNLSIRL